MAFSYLLYTVRVNSSTVYALNNSIDPKQAYSFGFGFQIVESLVLPHITKRPSVGLQSVILSKIKHFTGQSGSEGTSDTELHATKLERPMRCKICLENIQGKNQKSKKNMLKKIKSACQQCGNPLCKEHVSQVCYSCLKKIKTVICLFAFGYRM